MATNTTNLGLYKKDPLTDGNDYFNVNTMLNDNWDKIDINAKNIDDRIKKIEEPAHGAPVTTSDKVSYNNDALFGEYDITISGQTEANHANVGKDLANITTEGTTKVDSNGIHLVSGAAILPTNLKDNTEYTLILNISDITADHFTISGSSSCFPQTDLPITIGLHKVKLITDATITNSQIRFYIYNHDGTEYVDFNDIMILEGDYTSKDISYFEGVCSVFEGLGEGIESVNENLFDDRLEEGTINTLDGSKATSTLSIRSIDYIEVKPSTQYTVKAFDLNIIQYGIAEYDSADNFIKHTQITASEAQITTDNSTEKMRLRYTFNDESNVVTNVDSVLSFGSVIPSTHIKHYSQALEIGKALQAIGITGGLKRVGSTYDEVSDGKLIRRVSDDYTFQASDLGTGTDLGTVYRYGVSNLSTRLNNILLNGNTQTIYFRNAQLPYLVGYNTDSEHFYQDQTTNTLYIYIDKTKVADSTAQSLIDYFTDNSVFLNYQLAQEPDPRDLNLPTLNSFDIGTLIQNSKVPATLVYTYPTNLGQSLKDIEEQLQDHEERLTILDRYGSKPLDLDYTNPIEHVKANISDTPNIVVTGNKLVMNLLGNVGNCEDISKVSVTNSSILTNYSSDKKFGTQCIKVEHNEQDSSGFQIDVTFKIDTSKYYLASGYVKTENEPTSGVTVYLADKAYSVIGGVGDRITQNIWSKVGNKVGPSDLASKDTSVIRFLVNNHDTSRTSIVYADGLMLTEITKAEYDNLSVDELLEKYTYHNSVQPLQNPIVEVVNGDNLFNHNNVYYTTFDYDNPRSGIFKRSNETRNIFEWLGGNKFKIGCTEDDYRGSTIYFDNLKPNTQYTIGVDFDDISSGGVFHLYNEGNSFTISSTGRTSNTYTSTENGTLHFNLEAKGVTGTAIVSDIMLNEGTYAKLYTPFKGKGTIIFPIELCSENDKITWNGGGTATVERKWRKVTLDGDLDWGFQADKTGYKNIKITNFFGDSYTPSNIYTRKRDGMLLSHADPGANSESTFFSNGIYYIAVSDTDSGWGESYTPTTDEIKAYFNGWIMSDDTNSLYSSGEKYWHKRYQGIGAEAVLGFGPSIESGTSVDTVPTIKSYDDVTEVYQLFYQLATKETEEIDVHILDQAPLITEGANTVIVDSGLVYEKAIINTNNAGWYGLNYKGVYVEGWVYQTYGIGKILGIYKLSNGVLSREQLSYSGEANSWQIANDTKVYLGFERAAIEEEYYDPLAEYYILYEMTDEEYNNQQVTATLTMEDNLRDSHENLEEVVADNTKEISVIKQLLVDTYLKGNGDRLEFGRDAISATSSASASTTITFQKAFTSPPIINVTSGDSYRHATVSTVTSTQAVIYLRHINDGTWTGTVDVNWIAIGK